MDNRTMFDPGSLPAAHDAVSLEDRVQRLEAAVAALQDTHLMEERLIERLRSGESSGPGVGPPESIPEDPGLPAPAPPTGDAAPHSPAPLGGLAEVSAIFRMFFDIRYHVAWTTRVLVLLFIAMILTSQWWFPPAWIVGVGFLFDKVFTVLLAFLLYKVLAAEARRYVRAQSPSS